jgi:nucleotide-binding universal stress UspA family protein
VLEVGLLRDSISFAGGEVASLIEKATEAAGRLVEEVATQVAGHAITTSTAVIQGHPRIEIAEYANQWGADLVVVGSHGRSAVTRLLLGSVARTVLRSAPCSVEIVRGRTRRDSGAMRILLATDGSPYSVAAAQSIADRPWPRGTAVRVIGVAEAAPHIVNREYIDPGLTQSLGDDQLRQAQLTVSSAEQIIKSADVMSSTTVSVGVASGAILDEADAWDADLIVLGSHGRHGLDRLLIGSVSESVAIHARCSVEVVRKKTT